MGEAIRSGRVPAHALHKAGTGKDAPAADPLAARGAEPAVAEFKGLNAAYFKKEAPVAPPVAEPALRVGSFDPVEGAIPPEAAQYEAGREWRAFYYAETGAGYYRENSSASTDIFGGAGDDVTFWPLRVGGGLNADVTERHSLNATLDYRFRWYDSDRRNDSDWRWNVNLSRPVDDDGLRLAHVAENIWRGSP